MGSDDSRGAHTTAGSHTPTDPRPLVTLHALADPTVFPVLRKMAAAAARSLGASMLEAADVELSVGEALANAYFHAYGNRPGPVVISIDFDGIAFTISVRDEGRGMPEHLEMGRGISLLQELTDGVTLHAAPDGIGAVLRITRRLG
jgi:anti-sigma regulatory factor (Ser/Thr protein kinase)